MQRSLLSHAALSLAVLLLSVPALAATPLNIVVFGGTGNIGQRIVAEALTRGAAVTVVVRDPAATALAPDPKLTVVKGDVLDAAADARLLRGARAVVCAVSFRRPPDPAAYPKAAAALVAALRRLGAAAPHLIFVGGAGSLEVRPGVLLVDSMPAAYRGEVLGQKDALDYLRTIKDAPWTYFSPAGSITQGTRTGKFRLGTDQLIVAADGSSHISMEDYAVAVLDEIQMPAHLRQRFTIGY
ncbi:MAG TPA: NAD(P)H-binding protein [Steroidobacteraceae bacterium]|jgi:putative NADH-flavin reductase|nr:NAD(P)H-binding protein [Steroidobacteraceae bacterium]